MDHGARVKRPEWYHKDAVHWTARRATRCRMPGGIRLAMPWCASGRAARDGAGGRTFAKAVSPSQESMK